MRYYEIILIIRPDQSENITHIIDIYKKIIILNKGKIYRLEDWGRKSLSYAIQKLRKAHFLLMNIKATVPLIKELERHFKFNNNIIRSLILINKKSIKKISPMLKIKNDNKKIFFVI
ncbi:30S ribosomal protein S6 [Buchnera aphidicola (Cinara tujafilina)]|uniref:Small ribosomal subunit protein bS6 n=1 Tax=Buchnera aphidicola (Cinara tujafilina) TaxID=261317 RepID=F7WZR4_9GAMM|nr:30S ribosomal protein S6 [Buchnera aphidicola]AEH39940.1 30S ribosomal protein S6 [Buchnera aphidicola (Cinara tujafilina)]